MSAIKGSVGYLDASVLQCGGQLEWEKPLHHTMMDESIHIISFLNFIATNRIFFIHLIFMYEFGKSPNHSGSESLPMLRHCRSRSYGVVAVSKIYQNFKTNRRLLRYHS